MTIGWSATSIAAQTSNKPLTGYNAIIVEKATVEKNPKMAKFPAGYDTDLQQKIVADLQKKGVFAEIIDAGAKPGDEALVVDTNSPNNKRLLLSTKIIDFSPGNKALRYTIGWGAGATKVKAKFVFTDAATGREIFNTTLQGKFLGFVTILTLAFSGHMAVSFGVIIAFILAFFAVPAIFAHAGTNEQRGSRALDWYEFLDKGVLTATGRCRGSEAAILVLMLPFLIFFFGVAVALIAALV